MAPSTRATRRTKANEKLDNTESPENALPHQTTRKTPRKTPRTAKSKVDGFVVPGRSLREGPVLRSSLNNQEAAPRNTESNRYDSAVKDAMVESVRGSSELEARSGVEGTLEPGQMKLPIRKSPVLAPSSLHPKTSQASNDEVFKEKNTRTSNNVLLPQTPIPTPVSQAGFEVQRSVSPFSAVTRGLWPSEARRASWSSQESFGTPPSLPEDQLPKDSEECIEWLMNWAIEHGLEGTLSTDIGPEFASRFASFDPYGIDGMDFHAPTNAGYDMKSSFTGMVAEGSRKLYARGVRRWIEEPEQLATKLVVEKVVDEKLKEATGPEDEIDVKWDFDQKVGYLAGRQNKKHLFENTWGSDGTKHFDIFKPMDNKNPNTFEFQVNLRYLIGGYGDISRVVTIYLDYMTPFYEFLKDVQDHTSGCTIPPKDSLNPQFIVHKMPPRKVETEIQDGEDSAMEGYDPNAPIASNELGEKRNPELTSNVITPSPTQETFTDAAIPNALIPPFNQVPARGYTLEHGPWVYCRALLSQAPEHAPKLGDEWSKIENEDDYKSMMQELYEANKSNIQAAKAKAKSQNSRIINDEDPETTHVLFVMHSLDYEQYLNAQNRKELEKKDDDEWCEMFRGIPKKHDIEPGTPWSVYSEEWYEKHPQDPLQFLAEYDASGNGV